MHLRERTPCTSNTLSPRDAPVRTLVTATIAAGGFLGRRVRIPGPDRVRHGAERPVRALAQREHLAPLTLTVVYAVYAVGVVASLLLVRRPHLGRVRPAGRADCRPLIAAAAAVVFLVWPSLAGLLVARLLTGVALGASVATATAYLTDLDAGPDGAPSARSGIVATVANVGGLALGPLLAGALADYVPDGLTLVFAGPWPRWSCVRHRRPLPRRS